MAMTEPHSAQTRTPAYKFGLVVLLGTLLAIPLFSIYLLVYDRQSQSSTARGSIVEGWGDTQTIGGPFIVIPFTHIVQTTATDNGRNVVRQESRDDSLVIAPTRLQLNTALSPELRHRSIYEAVVYTASIRAQGEFNLPDLAKLNIDPASLHLGQARISMAISGAKGLAGSQPTVTVDGKRLALIPGSGLTQAQGSGFSGILLTALTPNRAVPFDIGFQLRGYDSISLQPTAQDTRWHVRSSWPNPSFLGGFLPTSRNVSSTGFAADWRIGNLAINRPIVSINEQAPEDANQVSVALLDTVDLYSEVNRATKYGFLFIGFTFVALLLFDILAGVAVPGPAYLLVGAGLILFFVLLLAFAEVIGFTPAYLLASGAVAALLACYAAAILKSWRRGGLIAVLLIALYAILYVLLSLEAYSLLIGSLLMFAALAGVMYITREVNWRSGLASRDE